MPCFDDVCHRAHLRCTGYLPATKGEANLLSAIRYTDLGRVDEACTRSRATHPNNLCRPSGSRAETSTCFPSNLASAVELRAAVRLDYRRRRSTTCLAPKESSDQPPPAAS